MGKRSVSTVLVAGLTAGILSAFAPSASALTSQESEFVSKINAERRSRGKSSLVVKSDLVSVARRHSARMAKAGRIWHNPNLPKEVSGWTRLGENVGMGPSVGSLHKAFMNSDGHRKNILGDYNQIGVGIVVNDGMIFVTEVFAKRGATAKRSTTAKRSSVTTTRQTTTRPAATEARPAASAPVRAQAPAVKAAPAPKPAQAPRTVGNLLRLAGLGAGATDDSGGTAAGF